MMTGLLSCRQVKRPHPTTICHTSSQWADGKVIVVEPFLRVVGCCFCKSVCDPHAILFPTQDLLNNYRLKA